MYKLLIIEDDAAIAGAITALAASWEMETHIVSDFRAVLTEYAAFSPHIVLVDISLPFFSGYHWCAELRKLSNVPIVFISSASDGMNIVTAMEMGADDFVAKPFDDSVLMAKLRALLRRSYDLAPQAAFLTHRGAMLDTGSETLTYAGEKVELTKNEYRILACLLENKGKVVSRERLMERLWETDAFVDENTLTVNVARLRKKLDAAGLAAFITTKFGVGYMIQ